MATKEKSPTMQWMFRQNTKYKKDQKWMFRVDKILNFAQPLTPVGLGVGCNVCCLISVSFSAFFMSPPVTILEILGVGSNVWRLIYVSFSAFSGALFQRFQESVQQRRISSTSVLCFDPVNHKLPERESISVRKLR